MQKYNDKNKTTEGFFKPVIINNSITTSRTKLKKIPEIFKPKITNYINKDIKEATEFLINGCNF